MYIMILYNLFWLLVNSLVCSIDNSEAIPILIPDLSEFVIWKWIFFGGGGGIYSNFSESVFDRRRVLESMGNYWGGLHSVLTFPNPSLGILPHTAASGTRTPASEFLIPPVTSDSDSLTPPVCPKKW